LKISLIWPAKKYVNKNETNSGLKHIRKFALQNSHTNITFITASHRYDLQESSCINREVQVFNRKPHKIMKAMGHVNILDTKLNRNKFTHHGLHLNISGKEKMANHIGERIINLLKRQKSPPIVLKWQEDPKDSISEEKVMNLPSECPVELHKNTARTSGRTKRTPITRSEDFLWTVSSSRTVE
jgi:hypothetical protein